MDNKADTTHKPMIISITSLKGGVGKTTLAINLGVCIAHMQYRVAVVDPDTNKAAYQWFERRNPEYSAISPTMNPDIPPVFVIGTTEDSGLIRLVKELDGQYDFVLIDGTPSMSELNTKIMILADLLIIPIRAGAPDFGAIGTFQKRLEPVLAARPKEVRFLLNEYDDRRTTDRYVRSQIETYYPEIPILKTTVKSRAIYNDAHLMGAGAYELKDKKAIAEMTLLNDEIMEVCEGILAKMPHHS